MAKNDKSPHLAVPPWWPFLRLLLVLLTLGAATWACGALLMAAQRFAAAMVVAAALGVLGALYPTELKEAERKDEQN
ncbi:hypothetical protein ACM7MB_09355 [Pseudomonas aeruginosa]